MPSNFTNLFVFPVGLAVLLVGAPAFSQSQPPVNNDPFFGVPAVDSDQMSAASGELAGGVSAGIPTHIGAGNRGTTSQRGGVPSSAVGTATRDISSSSSHDFANQGTANVRIYNNNGGGFGGSGGVSQ